MGGASVSIVYTPASGSPITHSTTTGDDGGYADSLLLPLVGTWQVQAHWDGDGQYLPSDSPVCTLVIGTR